MKKFIIATMLITASSFSFSQEFEDVEKPSTEENPFSMEVLIYNGLDGLTWQEPTLRFRYFATEKIAARLQIGLGDGSGAPMNEVNRVFENADGTGAEGTQEISRMSWNAQIGGEYHFLGTKKLSPYGFLGINLGGGSSTLMLDQSDGTNYFEGLTGERTGGFSSFGVAGGLGMEFYPVESIYVGLELGLAFNSRNNDNTVSEQTLTTPAGSVTTTEIKAGGSTSHLGTNAALRIGWRF